MMRASALRHKAARAVLTATPLAPFRRRGSAPVRCCSSNGNGPTGDATTSSNAGTVLVASPTPSSSTAMPQAAQPAVPLWQNSQDYLTERHQDVLQYFPSALGVDDFISRVEIALCGYGFTGENSIAMTNLCRDEVTTVLKDKIESVFGSSFNTNGLGAVLTCGITGIGAGLSHSPLSTADGRERYVFFSFPHIAIDDTGALGVIYRPNRPGASCACGAMNKALIQLKAEGIAKNCKTPGVHDPLDPEFTILKQRLARRIRYEQRDVRHMDLADITAVAERVITDDLEYLIEKCVDPSKADFAVVCGVQIHNWSVAFNEANLEFVAPTKVYVSVNGEVTMLDLLQLPSLTPRQISILANHSLGGANSMPPSNASDAEAGISYGNVSSTLQSIPSAYLARRMGSSSCAADAHHHAPHKHKERTKSPNASTASVDDVPEPAGPVCAWPAWQSKVQDQKARLRKKDRLMPTMDGEQSPHTSFTTRGSVS